MKLFTFNTGFLPLAPLADNPVQPDIFNDLSLLAPQAPATSLQSRLQQLDAFGRSDMGFADDGNGDGRITSPNPKSNTGTLTKQELQQIDDDLALTYCQLLVQIYESEYSKHLAELLQNASGRDRISLRTKQSELRMAVAQMKRKLSSTQSLQDRNTRITIIRSLFDYIKDKKALRTRYAQFVNHLARYLNIGHGEYIRTQKPAWWQKREARSSHGMPVVHHNRVPLEQWQDLSWEGICQTMHYAPRSYQQGWHESLVRMANAGKDRGKLGATQQTGKTFSMTPLSLALANEFYPNKTILLIVKENVVRDQIFDDLARFLPSAKVGKITGDTKMKEFGEGYDFVVASLMTIAREDNLKYLNPDIYGVICCDEATSLFSPSGKRLTQALGFYDENGEPIIRQDRALVALSADNIAFPDFERLDDKDLSWYINNQHVHEPVGLTLPMNPIDGKDSWEVVDLDGELVDDLKIDFGVLERLYQDYQKYLPGKKIIFYCSRIQKAITFAAYFNARSNKQIAVDVHSANNETTNDLAKEAFESDESGVTCLFTVKSLALGWRGSAADGCVMTFSSKSIRFGNQAITRMVGKKPGEEQTQKIVVEYLKDGKNKSLLAQLANSQSLPGFERVYSPFATILEQENQRQPVKVVFVPKISAIDILSPEPLQNNEEIKTTQKLYFDPKRFRNIMHDTLKNRYDGNLNTMADSLRMTEDEIEALLNGQLPKNFADTTHLAELLFQDEQNGLTEAWVEDLLDYLDVLHKETSAWIQNEDLQALIKGVRRQSLFASYDENQGIFVTESGDDFVMNSSQLSALATFIRGDFFDSNGNLSLSDWSLISKDILVTVAGMDEEYVNELIAKAAEFIRNISLTRKEKHKEKLEAKPSQATPDSDQDSEHSPATPLSTYFDKTDPFLTIYLNSMGLETIEDILELVGTPEWQRLEANKPDVCATIKAVLVENGFGDGFKEFESAPQAARKGLAEILDTPLDFSESPSNQAPLTGFNNLNGRTRNCLRKNPDIETLRDLITKSDAQMLKMKNFGRKSLNELKDLLFELSLELGLREDLRFGLTASEIASFTSTMGDIPEPNETRESAEQDAIIREILDTPLDFGFSTNKEPLEVFNDLSMRARNSLYLNPDIETLRDLITKSEAQILKMKNFGRKSLNEIKAALIQVSLKGNFKQMLHIGMSDAEIAALRFLTEEEAIYREQLLDKQLNEIDARLKGTITLREYFRKDAREAAKVLQKAEGEYKDQKRQRVDLENALFTPLSRLSLSYKQLDFLHPETKGYDLPLWELLDEMGAKNWDDGTSFPPEAFVQRNLAKRYYRDRASLSMCIGGSWMFPTGKTREDCEQEIRSAWNSVFIPIAHSLKTEPAQLLHTYLAWKKNPLAAEALKSAKNKRLKKDFYDAPLFSSAGRYSRSDLHYNRNRVVNALLFGGIVLQGSLANLSILELKEFEQLGQKSQNKLKEDMALIRGSEFFAAFDIDSKLTAEEEAGWIHPNKRLSKDKQQEFLKLLNENLPIEEIEGIFKKGKDILLEAAPLTIGKVFALSGKQIREKYGLSYADVVAIAKWGLLHSQNQPWTLHLNLGRTFQIGHFKPIDSTFKGRIGNVEWD